MAVYEQFLQSHLKICQIPTDLSPAVASSKALRMLGRSTTHGLLAVCGGSCQHITDDDCATVVLVWLYLSDFALLVKNGIGS